MKRYIPIISIAGSDSSGGAGIQADLKTISAIGCYGMTAITAITAQNTTGVRSIQGVDPRIVADQIDMAASDIPPMGAKTGMLFSREIVEAVAEAVKRNGIGNLVVDPVMISTSGSKLIDDDAVEALVERLFPLATLVTPNRMEAEALTGEREPMAQALRLRGMGARNVLLKGGDSERQDVKLDYLYLDGEEDLITLTADAVATRNTHGTGCTLSAAIACYLALGFDLTDATMRGKLYVTRALRAGARVAAGAGHGPMNHLFGPRHMKFFSKYQNDRTNDCDN